MYVCITPPLSLLSFVPCVLFSVAAFLGVCLTFLFVVVVSCEDGLWLHLPVCVRVLVPALVWPACVKWVVVFPLLVLCPCACAVRVCLLSCGCIPCMFPFRTFVHVCSVVRASFAAAGVALCARDQRSHQHWCMLLLCCLWVVARAAVLLFLCCVLYVFAAWSSTELAPSAAGVAVRACPVVLPACRQHVVALLPCVMLVLRLAHSVFFCWLPWQLTCLCVVPTVCSRSAAVLVPLCGPVAALQRSILCSVLVVAWLYVYKALPGAVRLRCRWPFVAPGLAEPVSQGCRRAVGDRWPLACMQRCPNMYA